MADIESAIKIIPIDDNLQAEIKKLSAEGWELVPGVLPVAVYHVIRVKKDSQSARGVLQIDDEKVHVLRDGHLVN